MQHSKIVRLPVLLLAALLAACGGNAVAPASTNAPTNISAPATIAPANTTPPAAVAAGPFAGIAQGTTPEGYHMLGNPSAPALLVMYSDFL